jgi:hypothetical protein
MDNVETAKKNERDADREQIEWVFGLTGGELNDRPFVTKDHGQFVYWYDGVPEYASSDYPYRFDREYVTLVSYSFCGTPFETLEDLEGNKWVLQSVFGNSGETECPGQHEGFGIVTDGHTAGGDRCYLCDEKRGDKHRYIYLGDGWAEVVYRKEEEEEADEDE